MSRDYNDTGVRCCQVCGESFYRQKYRSGRYEETSRFHDRKTCGRQECVEEFKSMAAKKVWQQRKGDPEPAEKKRSPVDVWLSRHHSQLMSVRYRK